MHCDSGEEFPWRSSADFMYMIDLVPRARPLGLVLGGRLAGRPLDLDLAAPWTWRFFTP